MLHCVPATHLLTIHGDYHPQTLNNTNTTQMVATCSLDECVRVAVSQCLNVWLAFTINIRLLWVTGAGTQKEQVLSVMAHKCCAPRPVQCHLFT